MTETFNEKFHDWLIDILPSISKEIPSEISDLILNKKLDFGFLILDKVIETKNFFSVDFGFYYDFSIGLVNKNKRIKSIINVNKLRPKLLDFRDSDTKNCKILEKHLKPCLDLIKEEIDKNNIDSFIYSPFSIAAKNYQTSAAKSFIYYFKDTEIKTQTAMSIDTECGGDFPVIWLTPKGFVYDVGSFFMRLDNPDITKLFKLFPNLSMNSSIFSYNKTCDRKIADLNAEIENHKAIIENLEGVKRKYENLKNNKILQDKINELFGEETVAAKRLLSEID